MLRQRSSSTLPHGCSIPTWSRTSSPGSGPPPCRASSPSADRSSSFGLSSLPLDFSTDDVAGPNLDLIGAADEHVGPVELLNAKNNRVFPLVALMKDEGELVAVLGWPQACFALDLPSIRDLDARLTKYVMRHSTRYKVGAYRRRRPAHPRPRPLRNPILRARRRCPRDSRDPSGVG